MRFEPKTEEEIAAANLLPAGDYDFEITEAEDTTSKSGNEMLKLKLKIEHEDRGHIVFDYLLDLESTAYKLRHFAESVGLLSHYERGHLAAEDVMGRAGRCKIAVDDKNKQYPAKNVVRDYVLDAGTLSAAVGKPIANGKAQAPAAIIDDGIPFLPEWR